MRTDGPLAGQPTDLRSELDSGASAPRAGRLGRVRPRGSIL